MADLTEREREILDFEAGPHWTYLGAKEAEIRERFAMSGTRYFQILGALLDRPEALVYSPVTVKRLRRLRAARAAARDRRSPAAPSRG